MNPLSSISNMAIIEVEISPAEERTFVSP